MKLIEQIRAEIKRLIDILPPTSEWIGAAAAFTAYKDVLSFLDTLQESSTWIKFSPANNLPRERVTIAYHTHDERKVRYAYGYFQFNPSKNWEFCGFDKDGNEQPKRVRTKDILYWKPVEPLPVEETHSLREWQEILANNPEMMEEFERQTPPEPIRGSILQEPKVDIDEEIDKFMFHPFQNYKRVSKHVIVDMGDGKEWVPVYDWKITNYKRADAHFLRKFARHFYELGLKARKEE